MARRKRRRTKKSRSQHPATRPRLTLGDVVRVKDGVMEPDYDGYCIGGWSGVIIALDTSEQTPMALIEWDASTHRDRLARNIRIAIAAIRGACDSLRVRYGVCRSVSLPGFGQGDLGLRGMPGRFAASMLAPTGGRLAHILTSVGAWRRS